MNKKPTFVTSDWHVDHAKSIVFDERPFRDLHDMHETLIRRYNAMVPHKGICYFLGDMGNRTEMLRKVISRLNGTKVLILGNHDHGVTTMYNCGFDVVIYGATLYIMGQRVTMSHCPLNGVWREDCGQMKGRNVDVLENWHGEARKKHQMSTVSNEGQFHLHGHIHSRKNKPQSKKILGRQYDVGVTANKYAPVSISVIESWIHKTLRGENHGE